MPKCPGQDKLFWKPDDVFDVDCPACGNPVEFFKTDPTRRCAECGYVSPNPRLDAGCAQWCPHAELCVGIKLVSEGEEQGPDGGTVRQIDRLLAAARDRLHRDRQQTVRALEALQEAQDLLRKQQANPRVVLAAVVLHYLALAPGTDRPDAEALQTILVQAGFEEDAIADVLGLLAGEKPDSPEAAILHEVDQRLQVEQSQATGS